MEKYDLIIIGGGPAGLTAAIYASRYKLNTLIISENMGGTAATAYKICNYPTYKDIKGFELMQKYLKHIQELKVQIIYDKVIKIEKNNDFIVYIKDKKFNAKKIIFSIGTQRMRLNIKGEGKFLGRGVSYCTSCDASFFKDKITAVVGGSNAALTSALLLSEYSPKVYLIYRGEKFEKPDPSWIELVKKEKKINILFKEEIIEISGTKSVEEIKLKSGKKIKLSGVFIETGSVPKIDLINNLNIKTDSKGYIITDKEQKTNLHGFFSAGDITNNPLKQIINASGEGAVAAYSAFKQIINESS